MLICLSPRPTEAAGSGRSWFETGSQEQLARRVYDMANTKSAKKAARQTVRRTEVNKSRVTRARNAVRGVEEAIASGDQGKAKAALQVAEPLLARTAQKGVLNKKTASRKVSRLSARVKAMAD
jgi:small subunit ribosomal protein S20